MYEVKINETAGSTGTLCEWCGRTHPEPLISVTIITPRGAFREDICESCREAYEDSTE